MAAGGTGILRAVRAGPITHRTGSLPSAILLVQAVDCDGAIDFLQIFQRREIATRVHLDAVYVLGTSSDSATAAEVARTHNVAVLVRRAGATLSLLRRALGYSGATLIITDKRDRVLLARSAPATPQAYVQLADLLSATRL